MIRKGAARRPRRIRRTTSLGVLSLGALIGGLLLFAGIFRSSSAASTETRARLKSVRDTVLLPTPVRPVVKGEKLKDVEFIETQWPRNRLSSEYVRDIPTYKGAIATTALPPHLPIPRSSLSFSGHDSNAVIEEIPAGMRAITVKVDAESSVEGWARSGSFVDVILLRSAREEGAGMLAKVIAENVRILSAGRSTVPLNGETSAPRAPATVTLLVSQKDALTIKTASSIGKLTFSLRGHGDQKQITARSVKQSELIENAKDFIPRTAVFHGRAKGPDGKMYVLGEDARWIRSRDARTPISKPTSQGSR